MNETHVTTLCWLAVHTAQGLGLPEVFDLLTHAAVVVTLPGVGAALVPVLRANSVLVHVVHHPGAAFDHRYVPTWIDHLAAFAVNVSAVQLTAQDAGQLVVREAALDKEEWWVGHGGGLSAH